MDKYKVKAPTAITGRPWRKPQQNIPQTRFERDRLKDRVIAYVAEKKLVPPIPFEELREHAEIVTKEMNLEHTRDFAAVLINNESWKDVLASVPYEKRLLLLPLCLRHENKCPAPLDEFGLLCKECGLCTVQDLQQEAERLGYVMLIAEGTPIVLQLIESGQIEAVVGLSCLNVLERVFPYLESAAVPGVAVPLLQDDCMETNVDLDWLWDIIHLTADDKTYRMDLDGARKEIDSWFETKDLNKSLEVDSNDPTMVIGRDWLAQAGKRWRPFLTVCAWKACQEDPNAATTKDLKRLALAVECFHKASLIHDDIEDDDRDRYGEKTLHEKHGVPVALNVGDYLLGEGYRLIAETKVPAKRRAEMLRVAALGHRALSRGQGAELSWVNNPKPMPSRKVLEIFTNKTAPAFEVALRLGALYANEELDDVIREYSGNLGIAYQIRDDLDDFLGSVDSHDARDVRPSLLLGIAHERAKGKDKKLMTAIWNKEVDWDLVEDQVKTILEKYKVEAKTRELLEGYKEEAVRALRTLENPTLKGLLRRVIRKIFEETIPETFCGEFETRNAAGGAPRAEVAAVVD
jgi:geranylgeranyl pyrophosphate synthase|tara:strand:- start:631 stop:2358 length:1728 start_codon:yes stop_codon:yes gene_type:complete